MRAGPGRSAVAQLADSLSKQRITISDANDKLLTRFDDTRKNPDDGGFKRVMTADGKRVVNLGPYPAHKWLLSSYEWSYEGGTSEWNAGPSKVTIVRASPDLV